jgi:hypothetical protein
MGPIGFPETSAKNYGYPLRNSQEERSSKNGSLNIRYQYLWK